MAEAKSKNQRDIIISVLRSKFHEVVKDDSIFPTSVMNLNININSIKKDCYVNRKSKINPDTKNFSPFSLESIKNDVIPNMILEFSFDPKTKGLSVSSEAGMFCLTFTDGSVMFFAQRIVGMGRNQSVETYAVADKKVLNKYYYYLNKKDKINSKPKNGFFKINVTNSLTGREVLNYIPLEVKTEGREVFHQNKKMVEEDIRQFFDNIELYTRFNQPGSRRLLLVGEPGGGKTSAANEIAKKYSEKMCVVIATSLKAVMMHTFNASKSKIPTLAILEDAESTIPWGNSDILNYLDGVNQPITSKGCYTIMTTNFPQRIEPRVLKRPGRIDKIVKFGVLDEENSIKCVKHYFENILFDSKTDSENTIKEILKQVYEKIVSVDNETGMTGAQIKNLSEATISYAISNKIKNITIDTLVSVKEQLTKDLKDVYEMADEESMTNNKPTAIGFDTGVEKKKSWGEKLDWDSIMRPDVAKEDDLLF